MAFQNGFGDSASSQFVSELIGLVGTSGTGGLAANFSNQTLQIGAYQNRLEHTEEITAF